MNIRVFNIRLSKEFCIIDQNRMNEFLDTVEVKLSSTNFVTNGTVDYWSAVVFYEPKKVTKEKNEVAFSIDDLSIEEQKIFKALRSWRNDLAEKLGWSSFRICHNSHLIHIAKENPTSLNDLGKITGFGTVRAEKYGHDILAVLNAY
ncbi:MAG TPA: HRDC domain-containing protein [Flavobacterium sp.]|jgi:superfamily II DNA helicase RecQ|uniref:HRDC domain-containing protein n=1 Tax=Flavobacterium sp. TaxID=239 RepID=UPI002C94A8B3|nr:HRDC domain-containing protein [Flavobacterium sp.]MCA0348335.1 HRDC domain-containing protein [Bacteroidota bacterium]HPW98449.1 HRDC domain-containing protein [Flavobacterium sp.]HQA73297.1 HRDC domain-containing protein [Flavobacterium sp.]